MLDVTEEKVGLYTGKTDKPLKRKSAKDLTAFSCSKVGLYRKFPLICCTK